MDPSPASTRRAWRTCSNRVLSMAWCIVRSILLRAGWSKVRVIKRRENHPIRTNAPIYLHAYNDRRVVLRRRRFLQHEFVRRRARTRAGGGPSRQRGAKESVRTYAPPPHTRPVPPTLAVQQSAVPLRAYHCVRCEFIDNVLHAFQCTQTRGPPWRSKPSPMQSGSAECARRASASCPHHP